MNPELRTWVASKPAAWERRESIWMRRWLVVATRRTASTAATATAAGTPAAGRTRLAEPVVRGSAPAIAAGAGRGHAGKRTERRERLVLPRLLDAEPVL